MRKKRGEGGKPLTAKRLALETLILRERLKASKTEYTSINNRRVQPPAIHASKSQELFPIEVVITKVRRSSEEIDESDITPRFKVNKK